MKNVKALIVAMYALAAVPTVSLAAYAEPPTTAQKTGEYIDDSALTTKVKAALLTEKNLKSLPISVESTEGVVTLSGQVVSTAQIDQAVDVAKHVKGVKDVHNALELKTNK
jgi:hyperosmotically inducible protein